MAKITTAMEYLKCQRPYSQSGDKKIQNFIQCSNFRLVPMTEDDCAEPGCWDLLTMADVVGVADDDDGKDPNDNVAFDVRKHNMM